MEEKMKELAVKYRDSFDEERFNAWIELLEQIQNYKEVKFDNENVSILCDFGIDLYGRSYYKRIVFYNDLGEAVERIELT